MDLLAHLQALGVPLAFVTGTSREETNKVLPAEILAFFSASVCGDEVMHGKPNPEPYMKAMSLLKVPSRECLVIENAPYGIQSAKAAGASVWAVRSYLSDEHLGKADRLFDSIEDILKVLKS
jgi:beta-phosphoglucomutase